MAAKYHSLEAKITQLKYLCFTYQLHLLNEWETTEIPFRFFASLGLPDPEAPIGDDRYLPQALYLIGGVAEETPSTHALIANKFNLVNNLRQCLEGSDTAENKYQRFLAVLDDPDTKNHISEHRDSLWLRFFKDLFFAVTAPIGLGLILSYQRNNSFAFWKSHGKILVESLEETIARPISNEPNLPLLY